MSRWSPTLSSSTCCCGWWPRVHCFANLPSTACTRSSVKAWSRLPRHHSSSHLCLFWRPLACWPLQRYNPWASCSHCVHEIICKGMELAAKTSLIVSSYLYIKLYLLSHTLLTVADVWPLGKLFMLCACLGWQNQYHIGSQHLVTQKVLFLTERLWSPFSHCVVCVSFLCSVCVFVCVYMFRGARPSGIINWSIDWWIDFLSYYIFLCVYI